MWLFSAAFVAQLFLTLGIGAGVVGSPLVAVGCWVAARRRGVPAGRYAALGLVYAWFLLYPGLLLLFSLWRPMPRLRPRRVLTDVLRPIAYVAVYALWLTGTIGVLLVIEIIGPCEPYPASCTPLERYGGLCLLIAMAVFWIASLLTLYTHEETKAVASPGNITPPLVELLPFVGATLSTLAVFGYFSLLPDG